MFKKLFTLLLLSVICFSKATAKDIPKWKINDLTTYIQKTNKPTVVNFWATYCKPCIAEIPYFQKLVKQYEKDSVQLLLVSLDIQDMYPEPIKAFAEKLKFTAPIVFLDETNADIFCPAIDEKWSGAIPASLFINNKTGHRKFFEGEMPEEKFASELESLVDDPNKKSRFSGILVIVSLVVVISLFFLYRNRRNAKSSR